MKQQHLVSTENVNGRKQTRLFNSMKKVMTMCCSVFWCSMTYPRVHVYQCDLVFPLPKTWHKRNNRFHFLSQNERNGRICIPTHWPLKYRFIPSIINNRRCRIRTSHGVRFSVAAASISFLFVSVYIPKFHNRTQPNWKWELAKESIK